MNVDFAKAYLKNALGKSLSEGSATFLEEMAETLTVDQLSKLVRVLQRVLDKKKNVIEHKR